MEDFEMQADTLIKRFKEKGYQEKNLVKLKTEIKRMDRNTLLVKKNVKK